MCYSVLKVILSCLARPNMEHAISSNRVPITDVASLGTLSIAADVFEETVKDKWAALKTRAADLDQFLKSLKDQHKWYLPYSYILNSHLI